MPNDDKTVLPRSNKVYAKKEYWEKRFAEEESFEWLVSYDEVAPQLERYLPPNKCDPILIVGCGNSPFSYEMYLNGYTNITSIDYSTNVIDAMRKKYTDVSEEFKWVCADMTDLKDEEFPTNSFACVIDKAAMDALMSEEGDVWNPNQSVVDSCRKMCAGISRILKEGGFHIHISFAQPHFRSKYLLGQHPPSEEVPRINKIHDENCEFAWDLKVEKIGGDDSSGCFHHFMYIMQKKAIL